MRTKPNDRQFLFFAAKKECLAGLVQFEKYPDNSINVKLPMYAMHINTDFTIVLDNINLLYLIC